MQDFNNFDINVEIAVMMYHLNKGFLQYHSLSMNLNDESN